MRLDDKRVVVSGGSGSGNGTVNYSVDINSTGAARSPNFSLRWCWWRFSDWE